MEYVIEQSKGQDLWYLWNAKKTKILKMGTLADTLKFIEEGNHGNQAQQTNP